MSVPALRLQSGPCLLDSGKQQDVNGGSVLFSQIA